MKPVDPRLLRYARAARGFFVLAAVIGVLQTLTVIAFAWLLTEAIIGAIAGKAVTGLLAALVGVALLRGVLIAASDAAATRASAQTGSQLRSALIGAVGRLGPAWLARQNQAGLAVTAGHGLDALDAYFARYVPQLVLTAITTPVLLAVMWWRDWSSGLTATIALPLIPLFLILIGIATKSVQDRQWKTLQHLAARFADTVQGLSTLRLFGRERRAERQIQATADTYRRETMTVLRYSFLSGFSMELLASLAVALIAVSIGLRLLSGDLTLEIGLFVLLLAPEAFLPIRQVGVQFHAASEGVAATEDIFAVLDEDRARGGVVQGGGSVHGNASARGEAPVHGTVSMHPDVLDGLGGTVSAARDRPDAPFAGASLRVDALRVRRGEKLLSPVTFRAEPGTVTLLEGPSGAGKSSLLAALRGAADYEGTATVSGTDLRMIAPSDWLAWAGQTPGLLRGSVAENVALGDPDPSPERIRASLEEACAEGIDAAQELGVQGTGLSGGQAQRVAVARAFYRQSADPSRVLLLDEPSSALDPDTEAALWSAVRARADVGATVVLVSHRRSARNIANQVISLGVDA